MRLLPVALCSTTGMLFYNSMLSLPMLLGAVVLRGEPGRLSSYPLLWDPQFQLVVSGAGCCFATPLWHACWCAAHVLVYPCQVAALSGLFKLSSVHLGELHLSLLSAQLLLASALGLSINHSTFVCTRVNEPLMTSVAGELMHPDTQHSAH